MRYNNDLTAEYVRELLKYDENTGILTWKIRSTDKFICKFPQRAASVWNKRFSGKDAGAYYRKQKTIGINNKKYAYHRIAWLHYYGEWPTEIVDHIDGNTDNNCISNLRPASVAQNGYNRGKNKNNTSGFKGVYWIKGKNKWRAEITVNRKPIHLGHYSSPVEAAQAYQKHANELHGEFAFPKAAEGM
jgi:HNH endonuclease/AP2 domain